MLSKTEKDELSEFFVENFTNINMAKDQINESFKLYGVDFKYPCYDDFCKDFLLVIEEYGVTLEKISDVSVVAFLISKMILNKIPMDRIDQIRESDEFKLIKRSLDI